MEKHKVLYFVAILSCVGIFALMITHFFGGMFIWILSFWFVFIPLILLYIISFFDTLICLIDKGYSRYRRKISVHLTTLCAIVLFNVYDLELFKSTRVLSATLHDDLFHYNLILREDGTCENKVNGFMGFEDKYSGTYIFKNDTIVFTKVPYDNDFIPDTILYNKKEKAIFITKDAKGNFTNKKEFLNHFVVDTIQ